MYDLCNLNCLNIKLDSYEFQETTETSTAIYNCVLLTLVATEQEVHPVVRVVVDSQVKMRSEHSPLVAVALGLDAEQLIHLPFQVAVPEMVHWI